MIFLIHSNMLNPNQSLVFVRICNEWIDVSSILADLISFIKDDIPSNSDSIQLPNESLNNVKLFTLFELNTIESIEIGNDCFENVDIFNIDGLNHLKSVKIGMNSFTRNKSDNWNCDIISNGNRSFHILNCDELESIEIGRYSFSDYAGEFELKNLPKLSTIKIGEIRRKSYNFCFSSFVIKGIIELILLMNRSSTFEFDWIRWFCIRWFLINSDIKYLNDLNDYLIDLPHLNSIKLGRYALEGDSDYDDVDDVDDVDDDCSLKMESDIDMNELMNRSSESNICHF